MSFSEAGLDLRVEFSKNVLQLTSGEHSVELRFDDVEANEASAELEAPNGGERLWAAWMLNAAGHSIADEVAVVGEGALPSAIAEFMGACNARLKRFARASDQKLLAELARPYRSPYRIFLGSTEAGMPARLMETLNVHDAIIVDLGGSEHDVPMVTDVYSLIHVNGPKVVLLDSREAIPPDGLLELASFWARCHRVRLEGGTS